MIWVIVLLEDLFMSHFQSLAEWLMSCSHPVLLAQTHSQSLKFPSPCFGIVFSVSSSANATSKLMQKLLNFGLVYHITLSQGLNMGPPGFQTITALCITNIFLGNCPQSCSDIFNNRGNLASCVGQLARLLLIVISSLFHLWLIRPTDMIGFLVFFTMLLVDMSIRL